MEELDLKELFTIFWNKKSEIILITLIFILIGVIYSYFMVVPEYKSSTTLVLAQISDDTNSEEGVTERDLTLNSKLVATYSELMKRDAILDKVVDNLNKPDITQEIIKNKISVKAINNTELIEITVRNQNPEYAKLIASEITEVFREKVAEIYKISNIYLLDEAEESDIPVNVNHAKDIIVFAFIGIAIAIIYALLVNMLDNTIKTEQDIENLTGLIVLTAIPDYNVEVNKRNGGRKKI